MYGLCGIFAQVRYLLAMLMTMEKLITLLLEHPERFVASEIPCCLLPFLELHDEPPPVDRMPGISRSPRTSHQCAHLRAL